MQVTDLNFPLLQSMLEKSNFLIELDLSWNDFKPSFLLEFTRFLKDNRTLRVLNLSWNSFSSQKANS